MKNARRIYIIIFVGISLMCCVGVILIALSQRAQPVKVQPAKVDPGVSTIPGECTIINQPGIKPCSARRLVSSKIDKIK